MNEKKLYKANLAFIRKHSQILYQAITAELPVFRDELDVCGDNLIVKNESAQCYLHSIYDRDRETKRTFQNVDLETQVLIVIGIGFGEYLPFIARTFAKLEHLIIVEPNVQVFKALLHTSDFQSTFSRFKKVSFIVNQHITAANVLLYSILTAEQFRQIEVICSLSYHSLYEDYCEEIIKLVSSFVRQNLLNLATSEKFRETWLVNHWRNHKQTCLSAETLIEQVPAYPAIIVSAGPSLDKNIHLLKEAQDRAVIVAVGSAMTILEKEGIIPHFRMALDGVRANEKIFNAVDTSTVPLIFSDSLYFNIFPNYQGPKIRMTMTTDYLAKYFSYIEEKKRIIVESAFSIANVAMDFLIKWGCPEIILMGQDLCYTGHRLHAAGSWTDSTQKRIGTIKVLDINGIEVGTDTAFMGMKKIFENLIAAYPHITIINATEGGLPIAGAENKPFKQVLAEHLTEQWDITDQINKVLNNKEIYFQEEINLTSLQTIEKEFGELLKFNNVNKEIARRILAILEEEPSNSQLRNLVKTMERQFQQIEKSDFYKMTVLPYLAEKFKAIKKHYEYHGSDKTYALEQKAKILINVCMEIQEQLNFMQALFEEFKGERELDIIFEE